MAEKIVLQVEVTWPEEPQGWESYFYQLMCELARLLAELYTQHMDAVLHREAKEEEESHFLLDEHLGLAPRAVGTPEVQ